MIRVWHIGPSQYSRVTFTGKGGLLADGRWHHAGQPIVYTAGSEALAALEILAHVRSIENIASLVVQYAELVDVLQEELDIARLAKGWDSAIPIDATKDMGDEWLRSRRSPVLWVPSVHVANERNALLNPLNTEFGKIKVSKVRSFTFDRRIQQIVRDASGKATERRG